MNVISIERAQSFQPFLSDEVRSDRQLYFPEVFSLVQQRYGFMSHNDIAKAPQEGAKFQNGRLQKDNEQIGILDLGVYNDGLIAVCRTSMESDAVLADLTEWGIATFGFHRPKTPMPRQYTSWIVAEFDAPLSKILRGFEKLQRLASASLERISGKKLEFDVGRIAVMPDPLLLPQHYLPQFIIERRAGAPFALNRFFCGAPLQTDDHIAFLREVETLLA